MAAAKHTARKARVSRSPDFGEITDRLLEAQAIMECAYVALDDNEPGKEAVCFRHGLDLLQSAYVELDVAVTALGGGDA
jgi:hypothetical protein